MEPAQAYDTYLGPAIFAPLARLVLAAAAVRAGERVVDVACGTGIVARQLVGQAARVTGVDINPAMLAVAATHAPAGEWIEGSGTALPLPDGAFDVAICQQGLQFFPDRAAGARELRRVLAPGGRAIVACWQPLAAQTLMRELVTAQAEVLGLSVDDPAAVVPFSLDAEALRAVLVTAGFARVDVQAHTIAARFAEPARFLRMTTLAALAVIPAFHGADPDAVTARVTHVLGDRLARYRDGDALAFPMPTHLAIAHA